MWGRRIAYACILALCFVFYLLYKQWLSWVILMGTVFLPWVSLAISLPAMYGVTFHLQCPGQVRMQVPARTSLRLSCRFPQPPYRCTIRLHNRLTGERFVGRPGEYVPVSHCGIVEISYKTLYVYDYLGLFRRRIRPRQLYQVTVLPKAVPGTAPTPVQQQLVTQWIPKPGGGFSENHDLRPYRPGDELRQIHWKMSAKTGKLIYREPIIPVQKEVSLVVTLSGSPDVLDRKLGRLLFVSQALLEQDLHHSILCYTAMGTCNLEVTGQTALEDALKTLLGSPATDGEWAPPARDGLWQQVIGGEPDGP